MNTELILRLHSDASDKLRGEIEKEYPSLFKLKSGHWYKRNDDVFRVVDPGYVPVVTGLIYGNWEESFFILDMNNIVPITPDESGQMLVAYAKANTFNYTVDGKVHVNLMDNVIFDGEKWTI